MLPEAELRCMLRRVEAALQAWDLGGALAAVTRYFLDEARVDARLDHLAAYLALVVTHPFGSVQGVEATLETFAKKDAKAVRLRRQTVDRALLRLKRDALYETVRRILHAIAWRSWSLQAQAAHEDAATRQRLRFVVQIDETQTVSSTKVSKATTKQAEVRLKARTESARAVVPSKKGRYHAGNWAHEHIVVSGTTYPLGTSQPLSFRRRPHLNYDKGKMMRFLLEDLEAFPIRPSWILLDKGFLAYVVLKWLARFCRDSAGRSHFMMPAKASSPQEVSTPEDVREGAMRGVTALQVKGFDEKRQIPGEGAYYACAQRTIPGSGDVTCTLVTFYKPKRDVFKGAKEEWTYDDFSVWSFYTDAPVTDDRAQEVYRIYGARWNCENLFQKANKIMGIIPSDDLYPRVLSFALVLCCMSVYGLHRFLEVEHYRRQENMLADESKDLLTRLIPFFEVARTDLWEDLRA